MPTPTFNPLLPGQPSYTVTNSKDISIDLYLIELDEGAQFTLVCPTAATVSLDKAATPMIPPLPLSTSVNITDSTTFAGHTITTQVTQDAATLRSTIDVSILGGAAGYWLLTINGVLPNECTITEGSNADIVRVLADPQIAPVPLGTFKEKVAITLTGTVDYSQVVSATPPAPLSVLPALAAVWTQIGGNTAAPPGPTALMGALPVTATASLTAPSVYASTSLDYRLTAFYDLDDDGLQDAGEPVNQADVTLTVEPRNLHMLLVLDRSGSMLDSLGGGLTKWEAARRAAHVWADLFIAFRTGVASSKAGVIIFEATACGWGPLGSPIEILNPADGSVLTTLGDLSGIDVTTFDLDDPGACTPIGDALIKAMDTFTAIPGTTTDDRYVTVLMTDGEENSGQIVVEDDNPVPAGAITTFADRRNDPPRVIVNDRMTLYTVGVGTTVQQSVLNDLPNPPTVSAPPPGGFYRLATAPEDLMPTFAEMLGHSLEAEDVPATAVPLTGSPDPNAMYFPITANERRLAVALQWDNSRDDMKLYWRPQAGGTFTQVAGGGMVPPTGVTAHQREKHGIAIVDLLLYFNSLMPPQTSVPATEWKVEYWPNLAGSAAPIVPTRLLVMVDLYLKAEYSFDRTHYRTGDPMRITCRLRAGPEPVVGATVTVELARPGEGLGTFLGTNGPQYRPTPPHSADPLTPKGAMFEQLLRQKDMTGLPILKPTVIFADGTNELFDDGTHEDGQAKDGDYANVFTNADKEGTYTWRFHARGHLPDGSAFSRVLTMSKWVGVNVEPLHSPVTVDFGLSAPQGFQAAQIFVKPTDRREELLGPFRTNEIQFRTTSGRFEANTTSHFDGQYSRVLTYRQGTVPIVTVSIQGKDIGPIVVAPGFLGAVERVVRSWHNWFLRCLLRRS
jgi:hypothetical protein